MKHIIFSDLHSNYSVLESFLKYLEGQKGKIKLFFLGDLIGYLNFDPKMFDIIDQLKEQYGLEIILGNHDAKFLNEEFQNTFNIDCRVPLNKTVKKEAVRKKLKEVLDRTYIKKEIIVGGKKIVLSHGGITDPLNAYYYPDLKFIEINSSEFKKNTVYISGHTHHPFIHKLEKEDITFINVGSLGMPRNKEFKGSFLEINGEEFTLKVLDYDLSKEYERNSNLENNIKNRFYFGGNSRYINEDLQDFKVDEIEKIKEKNKIIANYGKMICLENNIRVIKQCDSFIKINGKEEVKIRRVEELNEND